MFWGTISCFCKNSLLKGQNTIKKHVYDSLKEVLDLMYYLLLLQIFKKLVGNLFSDVL